MLTLFIGLPLVGFVMCNVQVAFCIARVICLWVSLLLACSLICQWWVLDAAGFALGLRGGSWLLFLGTVLTPMCVLLVNDTRSLASLMLLTSLVCAAVLTLDCLAFYVYFEACSVPLLLMIVRGALWHRSSDTSAIFGSGVRHKVSAAYRMLTFTMLVP